MISLRKIIIISPHFPPSNLTAVHRARIFTNHLSRLGWEPIVLTVNEKFYEEKLDLELSNLINPNLRIDSVTAFPVTKVRLFGDIGIRAFFQLYKRAINLCRTEKVDFIYILIPSFYTSLLGRLIYSKLKIPYGIDYIDPWVHDFPGSNILFSRAWFSTKLANILEPIAVKNAYLITGVSEDYYLPILSRYKTLSKNLVNAAMPFGVEINDHIVALNKSDSFIKSRLVSVFKNSPFYFKNGKIKLVYAGALLPKSWSLLNQMFLSLSQESNSLDFEFYFIGTGGAVEKIAKKYPLWNKYIFEISSRIAYLDVLRILDQTDGIFILGSIESHYSPSKIFQAILSKKPILAVLHYNSSVVNILSESNACCSLLLNDESDISSFGTSFLAKLKEFQLFCNSFDSKNINLSVIDKFTGESVTRLLVNALNKSIL